MSLSTATIAKIDAILQGALAEGRHTLHEHEVYGVLESMGLGVPRHFFIRDPGEINATLLGRFGGGPIIVKTVSRDLAHNQRYGGVKKVSTLDPLYVRFVLGSMRDEVLSHFPEGEKPAIDGYLVVEFVPFTQALGNEIMIGMKADPAFGPVVTLTKGGDDAEFFAKHYDQANLILAPISYTDAQQLTHALKIRHKFEESGHPEYMDMMARAVAAVSDLGYNYSLMCGRRPRYLINILDLNPFVFSEDGRFLAVDGYAEFEPCDARQLACGPNAENLSGFFAPEGIAVLGVSTDTTKYSMARVIATLLMDMGRGDVYCVNPKGGQTEINGKTVPLHASLADIPGHYDLVVYSAPAKYSLDFLKTVPQGKAVILISGIPADMKYAEFAADVAAAKPHGVRVIGPNCMGVFYAPGGKSRGVNTLFIEEKRLHIPYNERSNTALFTQSGALGITSVERSYGAIFRAIVSFGNKVDVSVPDLMGHFESDPQVDVMTMYLEGLNPGEGRRFFDMAKLTKKPVIVYKSGRTEAGAKAAASHTASMSGSYDVFRAACLQAGCVLTEELDDFYNYTKAFAMLHKKKPAGRRVAGVVNAGLDATMGADTLRCLKQAVLQPETAERLHALNQSGLVDTSTSFLDLTPMTNDVQYVQYIRAVLDDPGVDCLFVAIVPHVDNLKATPETCRDADAIAPLLAQCCRESGKPVVVSVNAGQHYVDMVRCLEEQGLPVYPDIRSAIRSLDAFVGYWTK